MYVINNLDRELLSANNQDITYLRRQYKLNHRSNETWINEGGKVEQKLLNDYTNLLEENSDSFAREFNNLTLECRKIKAVNKSKNSSKMIINGKFLHNSWRIKENFNFKNLKINFYDYDYGIITKIYKDLYSKKIAFVGAEFIVDEQIITAYGRNTSFDKAESDCFLELLERHAMYGLQKNSKSMTYRLNKKICVNPADFLFYVEKNSKERIDYDSKATITWIEGFDYKTKRKIWIPKQFIDLSLPDEPYFTVPNSSGVALGSSLYESRLYALMELIERDAFLTFWQKDVCLREIHLKSLPKDIRERIKDIETKNAILHLYDMTFDIKVPTVLALIISNTGPVYQFISTATHPDPLEAISKAINECIVGFNVYQHNQAVASNKYKSVYDVKTLFDHVCFASKRSFRKNYSSILNDVKSDWRTIYNNEAVEVLKKYDNPKDLLDYIVNTYLTDYQIYFIDITDNLAKSFGLAVSKVLIPSFSNIKFGYANRTASVERLDFALEHSYYRNSSKLRKGEFIDRVHPYA